MQQEIIIDETLAKRVKEVVSHGLSKGLGKSELGQMCVEAAVNYACGLPHGDNPSCVGSAVRAFKIRLNDAKWSSNDARAKGMLKIAIAQLGSNIINQQNFAKIVTFKTIVVLIPVILRDRDYEKEALLCENSKDLNEAKDNIYAVKKVLHAVALNAYYATYYAAVAATLVTATYITAYAVDAAAAAATAASSAALADKYLLISANICLEALIELNSPGYKFLYLCES